MKINGTEIEKIQFGSSPADIDALAYKVLTGEKVATSSLSDYYLFGLKKPAKIGECFSIINSLGKEVAIVEIVYIETIKFGEITDSFAKQEGDGSLENWKAIHESYYSELLFKIGKELNNETLLVCEWFRLIQVL